jgi:hypothetical protein
MSYRIYARRKWAWSDTRFHVGWDRSSNHRAYRFGSLDLIISPEELSDYDALIEANLVPSYRASWLYERGESYHPGIYVLSFQDISSMILYKLARDSCHIRRLEELARDRAITNVYKTTVVTMIPIQNFISLQKSCSSPRKPTTQALVNLFKKANLLP